MTTGRINQVAFLSRRRRPHETPSGGQDGRGSRSRLGTNAQLGRSEAEAPRPRTTFRIRENGRRPHEPRRPRDESRGTPGSRSPPRVHPAPRGAQGGWGHRKSIEFPSRGKQHRIPYRAPARPERRSGKKTEAEGASTVRCTSTEPANPRHPITTHTPVPYTWRRPSQTNRNPTPPGDVERAETPSKAAPAPPDARKQHRGGEFSKATGRRGRQNAISI